MQTLVEAASHIAQEIQRTRQHLTNLEQALQGLRPLITIDAATASLSFVATSAVQAVEDVSIVDADAPTRKVVKPKRTTKVKSKKYKPVEIVKSARAKQAIEKPIKVKVETKPVANAGTPKTAKKKAETLPAKVPKVPTTGAELWLSCLGRRKLTTNELIDEALRKLDLDASLRVVIANRARSWLNASVKGGAVIAAGTRDGTNLYKRAVAKAGKGSEA